MLREFAPTASSVRIVLTRLPEAEHKFNMRLRTDDGFEIYHTTPAWAGTQQLVNATVLMATNDDASTRDVLLVLP